MSKQGTVYLVGGGPGDPGLLTLRAARLLRRADVVVHDALLGAEVLAMIRDDAERIDVGKRCGGRRTRQEEIHRVLVEAAGRAKVVVRLKGGDPFIFGRGGEEALALREAGIRFRVVPGITAGIGAAAYAGIPLTHRGLSTSVTLVTGHEPSSGASEPVDWSALARVEGTLAIYMGVSRLPEIAKSLMAAGRSADTPAAVVEWGTCAGQRTVTAPLSDIAETARLAGLGAPALVIIGEVVELREKAKWFERRPLRGVRVLVGRSRAQPSGVSRSLRALGAEVLEFPQIRVAAPPDPQAVRDALGRAGEYWWIVFTSVEAVRGFFEELSASGRDARALAGVRIACLGAATSAAARKLGIVPDVESRTFVPDTVAELLHPDGGRWSRILLAREDGAPSEIAKELRARGGRVDEVAFRGSGLDTAAAEAIQRRLALGEVDVVVLPSSTTARTIARELGTDLGPARVMAIGPATARTALACGLPVHAVPERHTREGLVRGVRDLLTAAQLARVADAGPADRRPRLTPQR